MLRGYTLCSNGMKSVIESYVTVTGINFFLLEYTVYHSISGTRSKALFTIRRSIGARPTQY